MSYRLRGVVLPDDEERDLYVAGDRISFEPLGGAELVVDGWWLLPGLVDVHTHPGPSTPGDPLDAALLREHGGQYRDAGVMLLRVPGSAARLPAWFARTTGSRGSTGAGPWLAATGRFFPDWGRQVEPAALPQVAVHGQHHEGCAAAVAAGADSLEHGMHQATELLDSMARQGTALVPTMVAFADIPGRPCHPLSP